MLSFCIFVLFLLILNTFAVENEAYYEEKLKEDDNGDARVLLDQIKQATYNKLRQNEPSKLFHKGRNPFVQKKYNEKTEATINQPYAHDLFENDIVLTLPQARAILDEINSGSNPNIRKTRQAEATLKSFWRSNVISYRFLGYQDSTWQGNIRMGLRHIEDETCIRFQENGQDEDYLLFTRAGGCWSNIGRAGGSQRISIGPGCSSVGIIAHETLHALGLWHEQARSDRDYYVNINYENIRSGTEYNFEKRSSETSDNMGQSYDFGSIMHYSPKSFSIDLDRNSLYSIDAKYQQTMGQRETISFKDAKMINLRYCNGTCATKLNCFSGGYTDPNKCDKCKCPEGYGGNYCEQVLESNLNSCFGSELVAKNEWEYIENPLIQTFMKCNWRIRSQQDRRIALYVSNLTFPEDDACANYVEIKYRQDKVASGARLCGNPPRQVWLSDDPEVMVLLRTNYFVRKSWGFKLFYREADVSEYKIHPPIIEVSELKMSRPFPTLITQPITSNLSILFTTLPPTTSTTSTTQATTTTTEKTTTIERSTRTTRLITTTNSPGKWTEWAYWSECSLQCGGCGTRKRVRACYGGNKQCSGPNTEIEPCGFDVCINPEININHRCQGQIVIPCELMEKLEFTASSGEVATFESSDRKRIMRDDSQNCIKFFSYPCMTSMLTININKKNFDSTSNFVGSGTCCSGYYPSNGKCYKLKAMSSLLKL